MRSDATLWEALLDSFERRLPATRRNLSAALRRVERKLEALDRAVDGRREDSDEQLKELLALSARVAALEAGKVTTCWVGLAPDTAPPVPAMEEPVAPPPKEEPAPVPPPAVLTFGSPPTKPGWYWRRIYGVPQAVQVLSAPAELWWRGVLHLREPVTDDGLWLGPVLPYVEPRAPVEVPPYTFVKGSVRAWDDKGNDISDRVEVVDGGFRLKAPPETSA